MNRRRHVYRRKVSPFFGQIMDYGASNVALASFAQVPGVNGAAVQAPAALFPAWGSVIGAGAVLRGVRRLKHKK